MRMKTVSLTAAFVLAGATVASAGCNWSKDVVAQTPVDHGKMTRVEVAEAPVDAWLIQYLEAWQNA